MKRYIKATMERNLTPSEFLSIFTGDCYFVQYEGNVYLLDGYHLGEPNWDYGVFDVIPESEFFDTWDGDVPDLYVEGWFDFMINDELQNHYKIPGDAKVLDELDRNPISEWSEILDKYGYDIPVISDVSRVFSAGQYYWMPEKIPVATAGEIEAINDYNKSEVN